MKTFRKNLIILMIIAIILPITPFYNSLITYAQTDSEIEPIPLFDVNDNTDWPPETAEGEIGEEPENWNELVVQQRVEVEQNQNVSNSNPSPTAKTRFPQDKIILNPVDRRKLTQFVTLASALPNFYDDTNLYELGTLTGTSYDQLIDIKTSDPGQFNQLVALADELTHNDTYLLNRILNDPVTLAKLFNNSVDQMAYEIKTDPKGVKKAVNLILTTQIDKRVIKTLIYLVTPKDQGGAGHWRIKVERITKNYDKEVSKYEREDLAIKQQQKQAESKTLNDTTVEQLKAEPETPAEVTLNDQSTAVANVVDPGGAITATAYIGNDNEEDQNTTSSHFTGQAVDISEIDDIKCTTIGKKRIGKPKTTPQAPRPIRLAWQTKEGYGKDKATIDSSFNSMFMNASQESILSMLSELNFDFESLGDMKGANFSDMSGALAQAFIMSALNAPAGDIWKFNLSDTLRSLGGVILADELSLPRGPFLDQKINSIDDLSVAVGRGFVEKNLNMPYGSLKGMGRSDLLTSIGKQKTLSELGLPEDTLDVDIVSEDDLYQRVGSRLIESEFGFNSGSFYQKDTFANVAAVAGKFKLEALGANSGSVDEILTIPEGTYHGFITNKITPATLNRRIAEAHFSNTVGLYGNAKDDTAVNARDEAFDLPENTVDRFVRGELTLADFNQIGVYSLSHALETNDLNRNRLAGWLNSPNRELKVVENNEAITLPTLIYAGTMGTDNDVFYRLFGTDDQSDGAFKQLGQKLLTEAVKKSDLVTKQTAELMRKNPEVAETINQVEFYKTRVDNIKTHSTRLQTHSNKLSEQLKAIDNGIIQQSVKDEFSSVMVKMYLSSSQAGAVDGIPAFRAIGNESVNNGNRSNSILTTLTNIINTNTNKAVKDLTLETNATKYETEIISKNAYEIVTGKEQPNFRFEDLTVGNLNIPNLNFGGLSFGGTDVASLLAGKINPTEVLLSIGSAKLAGELNLPAWSLKYAASAIEKLTGNNNTNIKDAFFRAIGVSVLEDKNHLNSGSLANSDQLGAETSIGKFRQIVKERMNVSQNEADGTVAETLNLKGFNLDALTRGDFASWSLARAKAEEFDANNNLPKGTTEAFVRGGEIGAIDKSAVSDDEIRKVATTLDISETALRSYISLKSGIKNPAINKIYFVDQNPYSKSETPSSASACQPKKIPAGSYVYYDRDGLHTFNSYALANEYLKSHSDQELDYLDEIAGSFASWGNVGNIDNIKTDLSAFLTNTQAKPFGDKFDILAMVAEENKALPIPLFTKIFARSAEAGEIDRSAQIDILKVLGYQTVKHTAGAFLNEYLGISFGSSKITPDNIFDMFAGNGKTTLANLGGTLLDTEMNLDPGTIASVIAPGNSDNKTCAMENASLNLIGHLVGVPGMELVGSLINGFGGGKIETFFGFPKGSFRGASLEKLFGNISGADLGSALSIPYTPEMNMNANDALRLIDNATYESNKSRGFYDKLKIIRVYVEGLGADILSQDDSGDATNIAIKYQQINEQIKQTTLALSGMPEIFGDNIDTATTKLLSRPEFSNMNKNEAKTILNALRSRISSADSGLGLPAGRTAELMQNNPLVSPDEYRRQVSNTTLTDNIGSVILSGLGLEKDDIRLAGGVSGFLSAIISIDKNILAPESSGARSTIYSFLKSVFGANLDKNNLLEGAIDQIVAEPWRSKELLIKNGIKQIDQQLGLDQGIGTDNSTHSLSDLYDVLTTPPSPDTLFECDKKFDSIQNEDYRACIKDAQKGNFTVSARGALRSFANESIATHIVNFLSVQTKVNIATGDPDEYHNNWIVMDKKDVLGLLNGDLRPLTLIGMAMGAKAIMGDNDGNMAVDPALVLNYQDYYTAVYGNPETEDYARRRAEASVYADFNYAGGELPITDIEETPNIVVPSNTQNGVMSVAKPSDVNAETIEDINLAYPISNGNTAPPIMTSNVPNHTDPRYQVEEGYQLYMTDMAIWSNENDQIQTIISSAQSASNEAAKMARNAYRQNLQFKTMDCALYKLDKNIPAGFAKMMLNGNTFVKTTATLNYIGNWLKNDVGGIWATALGGSLVPLQHYFYSADSDIRGNTGTLLASAGSETIFNSIDNVLTGSGTNIMGLSFKPGTAEALFSFAASGGKTNIGYQFGNKEGQSLKSIQDVYGENFIYGTIGGWVDKKIGLPTGTTFGIYQAWKTYKTTHNAYRIAQASKNAADIAKAKGKLSDAKGMAIAMVVNLVFSKQIGQMEESLGLVPGTGSMLVTMLITGFEPITFAIFVLMNLFGVYKTEVKCTADGYYPKMDSGIDASKWDVAGLGVFNGLNESARDKAIVDAAQYKAGQLVYDLLTMKDRTGDPELVPVQIMTGREEDVGKYASLVKNNICDKVGSSGVQNGTAVCNGWRSRAGLWANPQTVSWTHIGF